MLSGKHAGKFHLSDPLVQVFQQPANFLQGFLILAFLAEFNQDLDILQIMFS